MNAVLLATIFTVTLPQAADLPHPFVAEVPSHSLACLKDLTDVGATSEVYVKNITTLQEKAKSLRLAVGAFEPGPTSTSDRMQLCVQVVRGIPPSARENVDVSWVTVPEKPAILLKCPVEKDTPVCAKQLEVLIPVEWRMRAYSATVYAWDLGGGGKHFAPDGDLPSIAAGIVLKEPKEGAQPTPEAMLLVIPAPSGVSRDDLNAKIKPADAGGKAPASMPPQSPQET